MAAMGENLVEEITIDDDDDYEGSPQLIGTSNQPDQLWIEYQAKIEPQFMVSPSCSPSCSPPMPFLSSTISSSPSMSAPAAQKPLSDDQRFVVGFSQHNCSSPSLNESTLTADVDRFEVSDSMSFLEPSTGNPFADNLIPSVINPLTDRLEPEAADTVNGFLNDYSMQVPGSSEGPVNGQESEMPKRKRRKKPWWFGSEHTKPLAKDKPFVILDKLSSDLVAAKFPDSRLDQSHNCKETCKLPVKVRRKPKPAPPPPSQPALQSPPSSLAQTTIIRANVPQGPTKGDNLARIIDGVARNSINSTVTQRSDGIPRVGDIVLFRLRQEPVLPQMDGYSEVKTARVVNFFADYDLYEVQLFQTDFPFIPAEGKRIHSNKMILDWSTVTDSQIIPAQT